MKVKICQRPIRGEVKIAPSKSYAHRILLCSALAHEKFVVGNLVFNDDILATMRVLEELGAKFDKIGENAYSVTPIDRKNMGDREYKIFANESGSTLRFILPIISALGINAVVDGKEGLRKRPVKLLLDVLREKGAEIEGDQLPVKASGKIGCGVYEIDASQSSQNVTGLLYALSLLDGDSEIVFQNQLVSKGYIDISLDVLRSFGAKIEEKENGFIVRGTEFSGKSTEVEGDYSSAGFPLVLGALCGDILVKGLNEQSLQGDRAVLSVLKQMGADIKWCEGGVKVKKSLLHAVDVDATNIPDLIPIIAVACASAKGKSAISGVDRLKIKESDRLSAVCEILTRFDVKHYYAHDTLYIYGREDKRYVSGEIVGHNDHRIVMSAVVMSIACKSDITVTDAQAVAKSYPGFYDDMKKLGGEDIVELF